MVGGVVVVGMSEAWRIESGMGVGGQRVAHVRTEGGGVRCGAETTERTYSRKAYPQGPPSSEVCSACVEAPKRPSEARTDGGGSQGIQPYAGGVSAGWAALNGHLTITPDRRLDLSPAAAIVGSLALLTLGALAGAASGGER